MNRSRRQLLGGLFAAATAAFAQEQTAHIHPEAKTIEAHGHEMDDAEDPIQKALAKPSVSLSGFSPTEFLTSFDYGNKTVLPGNRVLREYEITAREVNLEIAPGISFPAWAYNGSVPGPTLRCTEGDQIRVKLINRSQTDHTIHFHGMHPSNMDGVFEPVKPGESYLYEFVAEPAGLQLYHCHSLPISMHMNRGLFGAFLIDPVEGLPAAKELVMIMHGWDVNFDGKNELYAANGPANFYRDNPIPLRVGERARLYLVNALEYEPINSFHLHANMFHVHNTSWKQHPDGYTDVVTLCQAERCILEFSYKFPGVYMFHAHQNTFAERGWMGHFHVSA
jgi:FtsP/CotA-like multicopper oxidase with cupredoxin domain